MNTSTILHNVNPEDLKTIIREAIREEQTPQPISEKDHELFTVKETEKRLRISQPTLDKLVRLGKLRSVRIGGKKFYSEKEITRFLNEHEK